MTLLPTTRILLFCGVLPVQCLHRRSAGAEQQWGAKGGHIRRDAEICVLLPVWLGQAPSNAGGCRTAVRGAPAWTVRLVWQHNAGWRDRRAPNPELREEGRTRTQNAVGFFFCFLFLSKMTLCRGKRGYSPARLVGWERWQRELTSGCNRLRRHARRGCCTSAGSAPASPGRGQASLACLCPCSCRHPRVEGMWALWP